jgi:Na+/H+-dicarboxylate symporter
MDIGKSFSFVFEDDEWVVKVLIAAGIVAAGVFLSWLIIPAFLAGFLISGYGLEITRRVIRGQAPALPAWDNWGKLFTDGLLVAIIGFVYALPIIIFSVCLGTPIGAINDEGLAAVFGSFLGCINLLWGIVISFLLPPAIALFAKEDDLGAAFRFGEIWALLRDNFSTYLVTVLMIWVASFIGGLGFLVCGVGWLVTAPYASFVSSYLYGQALVEASGQAPQAAAEGEPA